MNKLLLISFFIGALIIIGAVMVAGGDSGPEDAAITSEGNVVVPLSYQLCAPGDQCIVVDRNCGFCCNYIAVNARYEQDFNELFDQNCSIYDDERCECYDLNSYPSCVDNKCEMVPFPGG